MAIKNNNRCSNNSNKQIIADLNSTSCLYNDVIADKRATNRWCYIYN